MSKIELIDRIVDLNRSAGTEFLRRFTVKDLSQYLRRLESLPALLPEIGDDATAAQPYAAAG